MNYQQFLNTKIIAAPSSGFDVDDSDIHPYLKPHQRDSVKWAVRGGRRALFMSFGLGKTCCQLEWCRLITSRECGKALIVLPLGVRQEFSREAASLDMPGIPYITCQQQAVDGTASIYMTNYERVRDGDIDPEYFIAVSLDEASVLRSFGSKTFQIFLDKFKGVRYKLVSTATPSPNRYKELIHYAGYLEVMDTGQALTRFFQRDSTKANNLTLYPHMEEEFWMWLSSWALVLSKPSELGYSDEGYDLPPLKVNRHIVDDWAVDLPEDRDGQVKLLRDTAHSLPEAAKERNLSIPARVQAAKRIVDANPDEHFILWHDLEAERHAILKAIPESVEIFGTMDYDERERRVIDFAEGRVRLFATKKELSGQGCNFQYHCHRAIFIGIDYKFNDFIQAIHRIYRFQQTQPVIIDIIHTRAEQPIYDALMTKWRQHDELQEKMSKIIQKYGLAHSCEVMKRKMGVERVTVQGNNYTAVLNDCVDELKHMDSDSAGLIHTSIPFGNHYEYSPSYNDFGHNEDTERFFEQMDYLSPNLLRVLQPGRMYVCHVKDRVLFGNATGTGMPTIEPFSDLTVLHYIRHGFQFCGRITIETDVVRENNQTYRLGWTEQCKDGSKMGVGCPEYLRCFANCRPIPEKRMPIYPL